MLLGFGILALIECCLLDLCYKYARRRQEKRDEKRRQEEQRELEFQQHILLTTFLHYILFFRTSTLNQNKSTAH